MEAEQGRAGAIRRQRDERTRVGPGAAPQQHRGTRDRGGGEQRGQRKLIPAQVADQQLYPDHRQGCSAEFEEVVLDAELPVPEDFAPDLADRPLQGVPRAYPAALRAGWCFRRGSTWQRGSAHYCPAILSSTTT